MSDNYTHAKMILSVSAGTAGAVFTSIFGAWDDNVFALLILMAIDFVTGLLVAGLFQKSSKTFSGGLSSEECLKGIAKKVCEMLLVAAAYQSDKLLGIDYARAFVIWGLCAAEIISIMENAGAMGILPEPVQQILKKVVDTLNKNIDGNNSNK